MTTKETERLAVLETKVDTIINEVKAISGKLESFDSTYARKTELKSLKWVTLPTVILVTAALTALVYFFLGHLSKTTISPEAPGQITAHSPTPSSSSSSPSGGATATAQSRSDSANPVDSQTSKDSGGVTVTLPKVP